MRIRSAVPAPRKIAATREGSALGPGGLDRGARLRRRARRPLPRDRGPRASVARYPAGARGSGSWPALPAGLGGLPSASLHQLLSTFPLPSSSPRLCLCWLHPTGPNPGVPARPLRQGLAPRRSEGGLRRKRPMSIEKRVLPGMGGGCRERARAGGAAWGAPCRLPRTQRCIIDGVQPRG